MYFRHYCSPHSLNYPVSDIVTWSGVIKLHKIPSACGTRKWSATNVCLLERHVLKEFALFRHPYTHHSSPLFISCNMWHYCSFFGYLKHIMKPFVNVHTRMKESFTTFGQWRGYLWEAGAQCQFNFCLSCLWMKVVSVNVICQNRETLIQFIVPFQKQYKVSVAVADVPLYINGSNIDNK